VGKRNSDTHSGKGKQNVTENLHHSKAVLSFSIPRSADPATPRRPPGTGASPRPRHYRCDTSHSLKGPQERVQDPGVGDPVSRGPGPSPTCRGASWPSPRARRPGS
jgi:hypothetical protein